MLGQRWFVATMAVALSFGAIVGTAAPAAAEPHGAEAPTVTAAVDAFDTEPAPPSDREPADPGETVLLVEGEPPQDLLDANGAEELAGTLGLAQRGVHRVAVADGRVEQLADELRERGFEVEEEVRWTRMRTPNDPLWADQWGPRQLEAPRLWDVTTGASSTIIAVLDTGVDPHPDLSGALVPGFDILAGRSTRDDSSDRHGTNVALVAAARANNGIGSAGYCWGCRIMPVRVLYDSGGYADDVSAGIDAAVAGGADIINLSLGGYCDDGGHGGVREAVRRAVAAGVLVVAAAGNDASSARVCPAAMPGVIGVASTTTDGELEPRSNRGDWVDLAAPGCHVVADRTTDGGFCGTSSAAPAVSGIAGALRSASPRFTAAYVEHLLAMSAEPISGVDHGRVHVGQAAHRGTPLVGDWNGDGRQTPGWFLDGRWVLRTASGSVTEFDFGASGDVPVSGDWNGDGRDGIGVVRNGRWHLRNGASGGPAQLPVFTYGRVSGGDVPVAGDWNGDGRDGIGVVRNGRWHLRNGASGGPAQLPVFTYGRVSGGDVPVAGDWNGSGRSGVAIVRRAEWHLRHDPRGGVADERARF